MTPPATNYPKRTGIMLAQPLTPRKLERLNKYIICQPKLNGDRCRVEWAGKSPALISAYGNLINQLPHIEEALSFLHSTLPEQLKELDGELYCHGMRQQDIHSIVSRRENRHNDYLEIQLHVFDTQNPTIPQLQRALQLENYFKELSVTTDSNFPINFVSSNVILNSIEGVISLATSYVASGYEGIIVRDPAAPYTTTRPPTMLKWKPSELDEYRIVGVAEGIGWATNHLGSFLVTGNDGTPFSVGSGPLLTKENRRHFWQHRETLIGQYLTVKHEPFATATARNIPRCAAAVSLSPTPNE